MTIFEALIANETIAGVRAKIVGLAVAAQLAITDWLDGGFGAQTLEAMAQSAFATSNVVTKAIRGYVSLDTSVDPGDVDPFDPTNVTLTPGPGLLSNKGKNDFGTERDEETFASGFVTFVNSSGVAKTFGPDDLVFTWTAGTPPTPAPTYRNAPDPTIYVNPGDTVTVPDGASLVIPVSAEEAGSFASCPASSLSLTSGITGCSGTNASAIVGTDREERAAYIARCLKAMSRLSLGGPSAAYEYFATTKLDGTALINAVGNPVNINRTHTSQDSPTGTVDAFFASPSGAAIADDVTAANANIRLQTLSVPDCITYTGQAATEVSIHVVGTAKIKSAPGVTALGVKTAILAALGRAFSTFPIGGMDQVLGAGVIYTADIQAVAAVAFPGLYDVLVTTPAGATTALALGEVATLNSVLADWTITIVP